MEQYAFDLHLHSCLSPCGGEDNTPANLAGMCALAGIEVAALTDHNTCGNCAAFCPYDSAPYREKFTLFHDRAGFGESAENQGFLPLGGEKVLVRLGGQAEEIDLGAPNVLPPDIETLILTVLGRLRYLL